jgi:hypothetical protein
LGPSNVAEPRRPQVHLSANIRSVHPSRHAWISSPAFARDPRPHVVLPMLHVGVGLPHAAQAMLYYGHATNVNVRTAGFSLNYPFLRPSVHSPGLWARLSYAYPSGIDGLRTHLPAAGLYLTNEFLRRPLGARPLTMHLHAGVQQTLVAARAPGLTAESGPRLSPNFLAPTQFAGGLGAQRGPWGLQADIGYTSSQTTVERRRQTRALWNQSYRLHYRFL